MQTLIPLFIAWMLCGLAIIKGVQTMGKIVYFTATFPFIVITALFIRGVTLPGSGNGISFYVTPQWDKLASPGVWGDASSQIFYSFSLGVGALITLASHNKVSGL
jgi:solute carrier family 6 amino acid transporter-like protein 5/7/9/14